MKKLTKENIKQITITGLMIVLAVLFTIAVDKIDTKLVWGKEIGFSNINIAVHQIIGTSETFDLISQITMVISALLLGGMVFIGTYQLITGKKIKAVDSEILLSGAVCVLMALTYLFFEKVIINFRPVLVDGFLEASYPSSHILFSMVINIIAIDYIKMKVKNKKIMLPAVILVGVITAVGVCSRALSGMHWLTDIVGALIISVALVMIYFTVKGIFIKREEIGLEKPQDETELTDKPTISEPDDQNP